MPATPDDVAPQASQEGHAAAAPANVAPSAAEGGHAPASPVVPQPATHRAAPGAEELPTKVAESASNTTGKVSEVCVMVLF